MPPLGIQDLERRGTWRRIFAVADMVIPLVHPHYHVGYTFNRLGMSASLVIRSSEMGFVVGRWPIKIHRGLGDGGSKRLPLQEGRQDAAIGACCRIRASIGPCVLEKSLVGLLTLRLEGFSADRQTQERINTFTASGCSIFLAAPTALSPSIRYSHDRRLAIGGHGLQPHEAEGEAPGARV